MKRLVGPLTWAYAILIGGVLLLTPEGVDPIVYKILGAIGVVLGVAAFAFGRNQLSGQAPGR